MMHSLRFVLVTVALAACGGGSAPSSTTPNEPPKGKLSAEPQPSTGEEGIPCPAKIAKVCADGQVDGCSLNLTTVHICVPAAAEAGPPCEQEIAKVCEGGLVDACLVTPAPAATHVCVVPL